MLQVPAYPFVVAEQEQEQEKVRAHFGLGRPHRVQTGSYMFDSDDGVR